MQASKLLQLIRSLSPEEIRWLAKFVRSPYHSNSQDVVALFDYIRKYYPALTSSKLEKQTTFQAILPKENYNDRRLRLIMHRLSNLVEEFMVIQRLKKDNFQYQKYLLEELEERGFYDQFEKKTRALSQELTALPYRDESYYDAQWQLQRDLLFHSKKSRFQITATDLEGAIQQLDTAYLMAKLRYSGELLNRQNILLEKYEILLLGEIQIIAAIHSDFKSNAVLQVYNDVLLLMNNILDENIYNRLERNFTTNLHLFRKSDQATLLRYLINSTIQLNNQGKTEYLNNQFQLYKLGLEQGLFLEKGQLPGSTFLNIAITGTVLKLVDWVEDFISLQTPYMSTNALNLARAYWHFARKEFGPSNELLGIITESGLAYNLRIKSLTLRNHFELFLEEDSYFDLLMSECAAFEKFIRRNEQMTPQRAEAYLQFIAFLKKLGKLRFTGNKKGIDRLGKELEQVSVIIAKRWLREKMD